ncbi:sensor histidine kinase [Brevibacillus ginsengisoli]|uniref:sensor histidine kinase n=1 Tax=Brevibacillus ginsengisoli TaxID=363854 RepID=UPI003CEEB023
MLQLQNLHWVDRVMLLIRSFWFVLSLLTIYFMEGVYPISTYWIMTVWISSAYVIPLLSSRPGSIHRFRFQATELLFSGSFFLYLVNIAGSAFTFMYIPILTIAYMSNKKSHYVIVPALLGLTLAAFWIGGIELTWLSLSDKLLKFAVFYGLGLCLTRIVHSMQIIQEKNKILEQYAKQIEKMAIIEERNRLSRELHDTIGHTFITTIVGMDAVLALIDKRPEEAKQSMRELLCITRNGLDEIRNHIHQIAAKLEEGGLHNSISTIANEFSIHTGTLVQINLQGSESELSEVMKHTLIRCLQESLTNAKKHGESTEIHVQLSFTDDAVEMTIIDNGHGKEQIIPGFGITSMKERLAALQGTVTIHSPLSKSHGTKVTCTIPIRGR